MKTLLSILILLTLSCNKQTDKPVVTITSSVTVENGKWVINLKYSPEIYTHGIFRFFWNVKDSTGKSYQWFGLQSLDHPITEYKYISGIPAFTPFTVDSVTVVPDDYLDKYIYVIK